MTDKQAYIAMNLLLNRFWRADKDQYNGDLPSLLGSMPLLEDSMPVDIGRWSDWKNCVPEAEITEAAAFDAILCFLDIYRERGEMEGAEITRVIDLMRSSPEPTREKWLACVKEAMAE